MASTDYVYKLGSSVWGEHPIQWAVPPKRRPRWWQWQRRRNLAELEYVFGILDNNALGRFWTEVRKGQSVFEDAGGYILRCYEAMLGYPVEEPVAYQGCTSETYKFWEV